MVLKEFNARGFIRKKLKNNRVIYEITELGEKELVEGLKLFIETKFNINEENEVRDCVLIIDISGIGDEAFVEIRNNYVYKIGKDIHQFNRIDGELVGITKISFKLFNLMLKEFKLNENKLVNYEYIY